MARWQSGEIRIVPRDPADPSVNPGRRAGDLTQEMQLYRDGPARWWWKQGRSLLDKWGWPSVFLCLTLFAIWRLDNRTQELVDRLSQLNMNSTEAIRKLTDEQRRQNDITEALKQAISELRTSINRRR